MVIASNEVQPPLDPPTQKAKQEKKDLMSMLEDVIKSSGSSTLPPSDSAGKLAEIKKEMNNYLCLELECSENPLHWWHDHKRYFPHLSLMARKYLCIPATSVPSKRAFSMAHGYIVNEKRSCLLSDNVNTLYSLLPISSKVTCTNYCNVISVCTLYKYYIIIINH